MTMNKKELSDMVLDMAKASRRGAGHVWNATKQAGNFYLDKAHWINPAIIVGGGAALATSYADEYLGASWREVGLMGAASIGYAEIMHKMHKIKDKKLRIGLQAATTLLAVPVLEKARTFDNGMGELRSPEFYERLIYNLPENIVVGLSAYFALQYGPQIIKSLHHASRERINRARTNKPNLQRRAAAGGMVAALVSYLMLDKFSLGAQDTPEGEARERITEPGYLPNQQKESLRVLTSIEGQKNILSDYIDPEDVLNITVGIGDPNDTARSGIPSLANQNLKVRYFLLNRDHERTLDERGENAINEHMIYLGERTDLELDNNGVGSIDGIFQFAQDLDMPFIEDTVFINPFSAGQYASDEFMFLTQILDTRGNPVASKWWGNGDNMKMRFRKSTPSLERRAGIPGQEEQPDDLPERPRVQPVPGQNRVFVYKQAIGRKKMDAEFSEIIDVFQPHMYDFRWRRGTLRIHSLVNSRTKRNVAERARRLNQEVLPMISAFNGGIIPYILDNPETAALLVKQEVDARGWDGMLIDIESVRMNANHAGALVNFMRVLRREMPEGRYKLGIAVSPRFAGSETNGYAHHGFYNYQNLAFHLDYLQIMAYDFHKGRRGVSCILPQDKIEPIVEYAQKHVDDPSKIVFLMPLYGHVWDKRGRPIGSISSTANSKYLATRGATSRIDNGELRIDTSKRIVYTQSAEVFRRRHNILMENGITNFGYWKQEHATAEVAEQIKRLK